LLSLAPEVHYFMVERFYNLIGFIFGFVKCQSSKKASYIVLPDKRKKNRSVLNGFFVGFYFKKHLNSGIKINQF